MNPTVFHSKKWEVALFSLANNRRITVLNLYIERTEERKQGLKDQSATKREPLEANQYVFITLLEKK